MAKTKLDGYREMQRKFQNLPSVLDKEIMAALYQEAEVERTESMRRTPVDLGTLRASHHIRGPWKRGTRFHIIIAVGGPAAPYALYVHEDLDANHTTGQAKFLESTIKESAPHMLKRVAERIDLNRAAKGA